MNFKENKIAIKDLLLWSENARFPDQYSNTEEDELIRYIVSESNFKIKEFIEEVVKDFDLPLLEKLVVWENSGQFIVLEGNRRLTVYKLLINPEIIIDISKDLYSLLIECQKKININNDFQLDCLLSIDKNQCLRYIDRKHSNGNNEVNWLEPERINYSKRRGNETYNTNFKIAINNFVKTLELPSDLKNQILGKGYVTTFYRFITSSPAKELFGLEVNKEGVLTHTDIEFPNKLKVIIHNILKKKDFNGNKVDTRVYNKKHEIKQYLESIKLEDSVKVDSDIQANTHIDIFGDKDIKISKKGHPRKSPKTTQNEILFGRTLELKRGKVNDMYTAINDIYNKNQHDDSILSIVGMSLRLLVEVAARVHSNNPEILGRDKIYDKFLKQAKDEMSMAQENKNFLSLTGSWLENNTNIEGLLGKYAHGNIVTAKSDILMCSRVIGDVLTYYFKR